MNKKKLLALVCLVVAGIIGFVVLYRYFDSVPVSFTTTNVQKITIKSSVGSVLHESTDSSTFSVRIPKQTSVSVEYAGKPGYETGARSERVGNKSKSVSVKPYYSTSRLAELAKTEQAALTAALKKQYSPVVNGYSLSDFRLYHFGEWASAALRRSGIQAGRIDTFKVILHKEDGVWVVGASPALLFYEKNHKTIPVDILHQINYS